MKVVEEQNQNMDLQIQAEDEMELAEQDLNEQNSEQENIDHLLIMRN